MTQRRSVGMRWRRGPGRLIDNQLNGFAAFSGDGVVAVTHADEAFSVQSDQFASASLTGAADGEYLHGAPSH